MSERKDKPILDIDAVIYCERETHKGMIIGKNGAMLKKISTFANKFYIYKFHLYFFKNPFVDIWPDSCYVK